VNNKLKVSLLSLSLIVPTADAAFWDKVERPDNMRFKTVQEIKSE
jgi:hypothetical protein